MKQFLDDVTECYKASTKVSLRDVAAEFDITLLKVRKLLITAGVWYVRKGMRHTAKPGLSGLTGI